MHQSVDKTEYFINFLITRKLLKLFYNIFSNSPTWNGAKGTSYNSDEKQKKIDKTKIEGQRNRESVKKSKV